MNMHAESCFFNSSEIFGQEIFTREELDRLDEIKVIIKCILTTVPVSTIAEVNQDYYDLEGEWIPYDKLGFVELEELLRYYSDILKIDDRGSVQLRSNIEEMEDKSSHIRRYVQNQRITGERPKRFLSTWSPNYFNMPGAEPGTLMVRTPRRPKRTEMCSFVSSEIQHDALLIANRNKGIQDYKFAKLMNDCIQANIGVDMNIDKLFVSLDNFLNNGLSHILNYYDGRIYPSTVEYSKDVQNLGLVADAKVHVPIIKERIITNLQSLILEEPQGVYCSELPSLYEKTFRMPLSYRTFGFVSVHSFMKALPDFFQVVIHTGETEGTVYHNEHTLPPERKVTKQDKENILQLLDFFEVGLDLDLFLPTYKIVFDRDFCHTKMCFENLNEALLSLTAHGVSIVTRNGESRVFLDAKQSNSIISKIPLFQPTDNMQILRPEHTMKPQDFLRVLQISDLVRGNGLLEILPLDVYGPHCFFAIRKDFRLDFLSSDLELWYSKKREEELQMPNSNCRMGEFCCAKLEGRYHRGFIVRAEMNSYFATVLFIDFGRVQLVQKNHLYFLHCRFINIPNLAFMCGINTIAPKEINEYSPYCKTVFHDILSSAERFFIKIRESSEETLQIKCSLMVTNATGSYLLEELLCSVGLAVPCYRRPPKESLVHAYWLLYLKKMRLQMEEMKRNLN